MCQQRGALPGQGRLGGQAERTNRKATCFIMAAAFIGFHEPRSQHRSHSCSPELVLLCPRTRVCAVVFHPLTKVCIVVFSALDKCVCVLKCSASWLCPVIFCSTTTDEGYGGRQPLDEGVCHFQTFLEHLTALSVSWPPRNRPSMLSTPELSSQGGFFVQNWFLD